MLRKLQLSFLYLLLVLVWFCGSRTFGQAPYATTTGITYSGTVGNYSLTGTVSGSSNVSRSPSGNVTFFDTTTNSNVGTATLGPASLSQSFVQMPSPAVGSAPTSIASGDLNRDGNIDLVVGNSTACTVSVLLGNGNGTFAAAQTFSVAAALQDGGTGGCTLNAVGLADFNMDGKSDIALTGWTNSKDQGQTFIALGNGDGTFQAPSTVYQGDLGTDQMIGNFGGNGIPGILMPGGDVNSNGLVMDPLAIGSGTGTFAISTLYTSGYPILAGLFNNNSTVPQVLTETGLGGVPFNTQYYMVAAASGDFNGDGKLDSIMLENYTTSPILMLGGGNGTFTLSTIPVSSSTSYSIVNIAVGDFDQDGKLDFILLCSTGASTGEFILFHGNGDGTFQQDAPVPLGFNPGFIVGTAFAVADFNNDGTPDIAFPNTSQNTTAIFLSEVIGTASATLNNVNVRGAGTHYVNATYPSNSNYQASTSSTVPLIGTGTPTGITLTTSPNPSIVTNTVNAQIQVTASDGTIPTGSVTVMADGNNLLGSPTLNGAGAATVSFSSLSVGTHSITAAYPENSTYDSSSVTQSQTVNTVPTNTVVVASPASSTYLQCVTYQATVTGTEGSPTGSVSFSARAGATQINLGSGTLNGSGVTSVSNCNISPAYYTITASYAGSSNFTASSGTTQETVEALRVVLVPPSTPIAPIQPPYNPGSPITIPIGGFPTPPGGAAPSEPITIVTGSTPIGTVPPGGGTIVWTPPTPGQYPIGACYPGDSNYANTCPPSSPISTPLTIPVTAPTTLTVQATPNPATFGQTASITARVASSYGVPTGSV